MYVCMYMLLRLISDYFFKHIYSVDLFNEIFLKGIDFFKYSILIALISRLKQ
jgi:hypothetical protein